MAGTVHVGVLQVVLAFPGARSLKDRRQDLQSLKDRVSARFQVSVHELPDDSPVRGTLVFTTAGADSRAIRSALDQVRAFIDGAGRGLPVQVDLDVFPWHPAERRWDVADE
jgi:uncharacterized protein YlxP (DUF503 family)